MEANHLSIRYPARLDLTFWQLYSYRTGGFHGQPKPIMPEVKITYPLGKKIHTPRYSPLQIGTPNYNTHTFKRFLLEIKQFLLTIYSELS